MTKPAGEFDGILMSRLWVMVVFIAKVTMWLRVFWMHGLVGHLNMGCHCDEVDGAGNVLVRWEDKNRDRLREEAVESPLCTRSALIYSSSGMDRNYH
jgi:hypothetical protein